MAAANRRAEEARLAERRARSEVIRTRDAAVRERVERGRLARGEELQIDYAAADAVASIAEAALRTAATAKTVAVDVARDITAAAGNVASAILGGRSDGPRGRTRGRDTAAAAAVPFHRNVRPRRSARRNYATITGGRASRAGRSAVELAGLGGTQVEAERYASLAATTAYGEGALEAVALASTRDAVLTVYERAHDALLRDIGAVGSTVRRRRQLRNLTQVIANASDVTGTIVEIARNAVDALYEEFESGDESEEDAPTTPATAAAQARLASALADETGAGAGASAFIEHEASQGSQGSAAWGPPGSQLSLQSAESVNSVATVSLPDNDMHIHDGDAATTDDEDYLHGYEEEERQHRDQARSREVPLAPPRQAGVAREFTAAAYDEIDGEGRVYAEARDRGARDAEATEAAQAWSRERHRMAVLAAEAAGEALPSASDEDDSEAAGEASDEDDLEEDYYHTGANYRAVLRF